MNKIIFFAMYIFAVIMLISSCGDTLGINGADYTKTGTDSKVIRIDTMINFKKTIVEITIRETDTIVEYITVNKHYDPVFATAFDYRAIENFESNGKLVSERLHDSSLTDLIVSLDYNTLTPEISLKLKSLNYNLDPNTFNERVEIVKYLKLDINNLSVLNDLPKSLQDESDLNDINLELVLINDDNVERILRRQDVRGEFVVHNRLVSEGQLRGLTLSGLIIVPNNGANNLKHYSIELNIAMIFPAI
ncbi:MAG: hypothetical protein WC313_08375 [Candidatus Kapaibacterium sp.]